MRTDCTYYCADVLSVDLMKKNTHLCTFSQKRHITATPLQADYQYNYSGSTLCSFNGKEKDWESGFHYYGARYYWSEVLTGWQSVDPMVDKYPNISPYAYCSWNPVVLVDPDGEWPRKGVNIYTFKANSGIGVGYGLEAGWKYGIATDRNGMSHFSAVSTMYGTNQNLNDGSSNPALEIGLDIGASIGYERNHTYNTFYEAMQCSSTEFGISGKGIVGGSVGLGEDSYSASIGVGISISASSE